MSGCKSLTDEPNGLSNSKEINMKTNSEFNKLAAEFGLDETEISSDQWKQKIAHEEGLETSPAYEIQNQGFDPTEVLKKAKRKFQLRLNAYLAYEREQKINNPEYSIMKPEYHADAYRFGLVWFLYDESMARYRGESSVIKINGRTYAFYVNQKTLLLKEDETLIIERMRKDHFNNHPNNNNHLRTLSKEEAYNQIVKTAREF